MPLQYLKTGWGRRARVADASINFPCARIGRKDLFSLLLFSPRPRYAAGWQWVITPPGTGLRLGHGKLRNDRLFSSTSAAGQMAGLYPLLSTALRQSRATPIRQVGWDVSPTKTRGPSALSKPRSTVGCSSCEQGALAPFENSPVGSGTRAMGASRNLAKILVCCSRMTSKLGSA